MEAGAQLFDNFGTFAVSSGAGTCSLDGNVVFNNMGTVDILNGAFNVNNGASSGGQLITTPGATINFVNYVFTNGNTFTGNGIYANGATFAGAFSGILNWDGGSLTGALTIPTNGVFNIVAGGGNGFEGLILTNYGTVNWTNTTIYSRAPGNAQIYNYGTWNALSGSQFQGGYGGGGTLFENAGLFVVSAGSNTASLDANVAFNNSGLVQVESGALKLAQAPAAGGSFTADPGASLNFISTAYKFETTNTFAGGGNSLTSVPASMGRLRGP